MNHQNGTEVNSCRKKAKRPMQSSWKGRETRSDDASKNWCASKTSPETSDWHASKLTRPVWLPTFEIVLDVRTRQKLTRVNNWRVACVATPSDSCRGNRKSVGAHEWYTYPPPAALFPVQWQCVRLWVRRMHKVLLRDARLSRAEHKRTLQPGVSRSLLLFQLEISAWQRNGVTKTEQN